MLFQGKSKSLRLAGGNQDHRCLLVPRRSILESCHCCTTAVAFSIVIPSQGGSSHPPHTLGTLLAHTEGICRKCSEHSQVDWNPSDFLISKCCTTKTQRASCNAYEKINHCCQQLLFFCKIFQLKTQTAAATVTRRDAIFKSIGLFPVSTSPRSPRHRLGSVTNMPSSAQGSVWDVQPDRFGILCWVHSGSALPQQH